MRAPFAYFGGKSNLAAEIVSRMPRHEVYVEPFLGSGAVLFAKSPSPFEVVNDAAGALVAFFRCLRDEPEELARVCALTPFARDEYRAARVEDLDEPISDLELARRFWVRVSQSYAQWPGDNNSWSYGIKTLSSKPEKSQRVIALFGEFARRLASVQIENADAIEVIKRHSVYEPTVIYADPPYPISTRPGSPERYLVEMHDDSEHERLAEALHEVRGTVILSGYASDLYSRLYSDWEVITIRAVSSATTDTAYEDRIRSEVLWINRPTSTQLALDLFGLDLVASATTAKTDGQNFFDQG